MKKLTRLEDLDIMGNWKKLILWTKIENENKNDKNDQKFIKWKSLIITNKEESKIFDVILRIGFIEFCNT